MDDYDPGKLLLLTFVASHSYTFVILLNILEEIDALHSCLQLKDRNNKATF
jgi:hypothetical protein